MSGLNVAANSVSDFFKTYVKEIDSNIPFSGISSPSASNGTEKAAVGAGFLAGFLVPEGEAGKAAKIGNLTAEAEKLYPAKAGLSELHHVIPKYLGGAADGEVAKIPAAYHQLITNAFRTLAPYGEKIERSAQELGTILKDVYSRYPLP